MRKAIVIIAVIALSLFGSAFAKDHSNDYQVGTFISATAVADGTFTDAIHCVPGATSTVCSGNAGFNSLSVYRVRVEEGTWMLETSRQVGDSMSRRVLGFENTHFRKEKANPLDSLKDGDRVLFRVEAHKKLIGGTDHEIYIPYADKPGKEAKFYGWFMPFSPAPGPPPKPTDNVRAMCDAHKLSPELEKQLCVASTPSTSTVAPTIAPATPPVAKTEVVVQTSVLTNQSIADMVKAGLSDDAIMARIQTSKTHFDVSTAATAKLMQDAPGISMDVIKGMVLSWMKR
jgi:hypothetical protein